MGWRIRIIILLNSFIFLIIALNKKAAPEVRSLAQFGMVMSIVTFNIVLEFIKNEKKYKFQQNLAIFFYIFLLALLYGSSQ